MNLDGLLKGPGGWAAVAAIIFLVLMTNACHEGGHALVAWWAGDRRESLRRRCTLNPISHFHWFLTLVLPLISLFFAGMIFGGARPVLIDRGRTGRFGMALAALAGPAGNLLCAGFLAVVLAVAVHMEWWGLSDTDRIHSPAWMILKVPIWFSLFLMCLNLLPLPGLDGGHVVGMCLPDRLQRIWYWCTPLGFLTVLAGLFYYAGYLHRWGWMDGAPPEPWPFQTLYEATSRHLDVLIKWMGTVL